MVWVLSVVCLVAIFVLLSYRYSPQAAIGWVVALSWLFPAWLILPLVEGAPDSIVATGLDIKTTVATMCLVLYCVMPGRTFPIRLVMCDYAMLALVAAHLLSDISNDGFSWMILGRMYVEWYLPYVAGRLAVQSWQDANRLWPVVAAVCICMSLAAVPEAWFDFNVFESVFGPRPVEGTSRDAVRWGFQRAYGQAMHPIYFGVMQLLLLGWASYATVRALHRRTNVVWIFSMAPVIVGIVATASRGPLLGIAAGLAALYFCFYPRIRILAGGAFLAMVAAAIVFQEPIVRQLEKWSGERSQEIVIDGETHKQSSVRSRINVMRVNKIALRRSGLLGFGTRAVTGFPINVPLGPVEVEALNKVRFIDNTYILLTLRFGYLGAICFIAASIISLWQLYSVGTLFQGQSQQWFCHCLMSFLFAALLVLATVWMPYEIGFIVIWSFGISSGLSLARIRGKLAHVPHRSRDSRAQSKRRSSDSSTQAADA